jgi:hypothetical protein
MKVFFESLQGIFSDDVDVSIVEISQDLNEITYEISVGVNTGNAVNSNIRTITAIASSLEVQDPTPKVFDVAGVSPESVINSLSTIERDDILRAARTGAPALSTASTSVFKTLAGKRQRDFSRILGSGVISTRRRIVYQRASSLLSSQKTTNIVSLESCSESTPNDTLSYRSAALELISRGYDVTESIDYSRVDHTTKENTSGLIPKSKILVRRSDGRQQDVIQAASQATQAGFAGIDRLTSSTIAFVALANTKISREYFTLRIDRRFSGIRTSMKVSIFARDSSDMNVSVKQIEVNHLDQINDYFSPKDVLRTNVTRISTGFFMIEAKTEDPSITSCDVYSRSISEGISTEYVFAGSIDITGKISRALFNVDSDAGVIFRCVPRTASGQVFCNTSGDVLVSRNLSTSFGVLFSSLTVSGILLDMIGVTGDLSEIEVLRRDVTLKERLFETITKIPATGDVSYEDTGVKIGHVYEYKCRYFNRFGKPCGVSNSRLDSFVFNSGEVSLTANAARTGTSVTLDIAVEGNLGTSTQRLFDLINSFSGEPVFREKFQQIYTNFSSISLVQVERFNVETGESTDLGLFSPGVIEDVDVPVGSYRYRIEVLTRSPAELLEELATSDSIRQANSLKSTSLLASSQLSQTAQRLNFSQKFFNKFSLGNGTLSYSYIQAQNHPENSIEQGRTGVVAVVRVGSISNEPSIVPVSSRVLLDGRVILQWRSVNLSSVDHYIVSAERGGSRFSCGIAHPVQGDLMTFIDLTTKNYIGQIDYYVTPVSLDFRTQNPVNVAVVNIGEVDAS